MRGSGSFSFAAENNNKKATAAKAAVAFLILGLTIEQIVCLDVFIENFLAISVFKRRPFFFLFFR